MENQIALLLFFRISPVSTVEMRENREVNIDGKTTPRKKKKTKESTLNWKRSLMLQIYFISSLISVCMVQNNFLLLSASCVNLFFIFPYPLREDLSSHPLSFDKDTTQNFISFFCMLWCFFRHISCYKTSNSKKILLKSYGH